jgi:glycosyltransferase involved in cell wall biosynthesis
MTRIAHYTDTVALGGAEQMLLTLLKSLDRRQWESTLMFHAQPAIQPFIDAARDCGVRTVAVDRPQQARELAASLGRALRVEKPDIFHAHLTWDLRCTPALAAAWAIGVRGRVATQQLFVRPRSRRRRVRQRFVSTLVHRYIAVSHAMGAQIERAVLNPRKVCVVHNAIDVARFSGARDLRLRSALTGATVRPLIIAIARLHAQKGLEHLIAAARHVPEAVFAVAGEGPERAALERAVKSEGVSDRFHLLGHRTDIPELLAASDVFVLPSLFEGLPVSVLEAMAARTPVVASDVPGTREAVIDHVTGTLVAPADPMALAAGIRRVLIDRALAGRLAANGRARVTEHFSADAMARGVERVYQEVLRLRPAVSLGRRMASAAQSAP